MRMSHLFGRTLREAPGDVELPSHRLMLRAALMRPLGAGIWTKRSSSCGRPHKNGAARNHSGRLLKRPHQDGQGYVP